MGRGDSNQRPPPCQGPLENDNNNDQISRGGRWFESPRPTPIIDWQQFHNFLLQRMTEKTAEDRLRYAKQYYAHLLSKKFEIEQIGHLQQLPPNKRIHIMKALSSLARFTGQTDNWQAIRKRYGLQWSTGTEKIDAFTRFFDSSRDLDIMLQWLREAIAALSKDYANMFLFCTLTGIRGSECVEAVRLVQNMGNNTLNQYYNPDQQVLQHYRFPDIFIRRTKAVYISVVDTEIVGIAQSIKKTPSIDTLKMATRHRSLSMRLKYCRKIQASWLHKCGISSDLIDVLQGRISRSIFLKHYLTPDSSYKAKVLDALKKLRQEIDKEHQALKAISCK